MATRPTKTAGNTTYTAEVAAGATTIKATEVDGDLNEIYANITDVNIAVGASIATAKLASDLGITSGKLAPSSVTTTKLADLNVTAPKLAVNATQNAFGSGAVGAGAVLSSVSDTPLATIAGLMTRGGRITFSGTIALIVTLSPTSTSLTFKLKRGATMLATWSFGGFTQTPNTGSTLAVPFAFSPAWIDTTTVLGTNTFTVTGTVTPGAAGGASTDGTNPGTIFAVELA